jgi:hypothetical protein
MFSEKTPILCGAIPAFEQFMTSWEKLGNERPELTELINPGLTLAYKYYSRMDRTMVYVVTMCK